MSLVLILLQAEVSFGQYYPRGIRENDDFLPNLDEPDKWMLILDGIVDWEDDSGSQANGSQGSGLQISHYQLSGYYGGAQVRGGVQLRREFGSRDFEDFSIGLGLSFRRPLFVEVGIGFAERQFSNTVDDGLSLHGKVGYEFPWIYKITYRIRFRVTLNYSYRSLSGEGGDYSVRHFFPLLGLEFET